jgi:putative MATE family efflux protein
MPLTRSDYRLPLSPFQASPTEQSGDPEPPPSLARFGRDLTTGSIPRHLVVFSLPMLIGSAFQTAYAFINRIWVGQYLGETAMAAVTQIFPVVFLLMAIAAGMTLATNILISHHYGARDLPAVRRVVRSSTFLVGALSVGLTAAGEFLAPFILHCMGTSAEVFPLAVNYLRIFLLSMPMGFGLFLSRNMLQAIGDSLTPLYFLAGSVALNAMLDPVLMFGWAGAPALGLDGTAWATVFSQAVALAALAIWLKWRGSPVAMSIGRGSLAGSTAWTTIKIGAPSALQQMIVSLGMFFVARFVNAFGDTSAAAWGAAMAIDQWAFLPAMTFSLAISTLAGQNIGAGRHSRIREIFLWGCLLSGGATLVISAVAVAVPSLLVRIFTPDAAVIEAGTRYLRIVGPCYIFFAIMFVSNGIINGSGHTLVITAISLLSQWGVRVPVAWWLSGRLGSVEGVWYAVGASFGVSMVASLAYYFSGGWHRPVVHHQPPAPRLDEDIVV